MKITGVQCYLIHARQDEVRTTGFVHISFGLFVHERKKKSLNSKIPSRKYRPLQSFENNLPGAHRQGVHGPSCWIRNVFLSFLLSTELFWASSITHAPYEHLTKIYKKKNNTYKPIHPIYLSYYIPPSLQCILSNIASIFILSIFCPFHSCVLGIFRSNFLHGPFVFEFAYFALLTVQSPISRP